MADPAIKVVIEDDPAETVRVDPVTGTIETDQADGGVVVQLDANRPDKSGDDPDEFYKNLALDMDAGQLSQIANDLYDAIEADNQSRNGALAIRNRGLDLMGLKLQEPNSGVGDTAAPIEGMSSVTNPLLLDACLRSWANAVGELLPANGPVKIKDDGEETAAEDDLADALERDMNHYLTTTASEYYPDTSHMLLWGNHFGGSGFKKVYRCPMRRRPVSESVDMKDLIVSDTAKDLRSCGRITHQISMRPSVMKRMQLLKAYRDVALTQPTPQPNQVDQKIAGIQGTTNQQRRPEDQPYTVWETQCEIDIPKYAPEGFKDKGIPLPYLVTIDKDSREVLALRRDWEMEDDQAERERMYVKYPYVPGPGFYGTGLLNILGNSTAAMTAAWREALDAGMFASFPGGLIDKTSSRQETSDMQVGPGQFKGIETMGRDIRSIAMGMPFHDVTPGLMALIDKITAQSEKLSGAANLATNEGVKDVPVGTMLAQIEQSTKIMAAAHKGMHTAQSEEIELLTKLFRKNPEDFWRLNKTCPKGYWNEEKFIQALDDCNLVPVSDPNVPSHIHRIAKAVALVQLKADPALGPLLSAKEVLTRVLRAMKEDSQGLIMDAPPQGAQPDPKAIEAHAKVITAQTKATEAEGKLKALPQEMALKAKELQSKEDIATVNLASEQVIHAGDAAKAEHTLATERHDRGLQTIKTAADIQAQERDHGLGVAQHAHEVDQSAHQRVMDHKEHALETDKHKLDTFVAKHPPKPAKPKGK